MASYLLIWEYRSKCLKFPSKNRSIGFMSRFSQSHLEENVWLIFFPQGHCLKNLNAGFHKQSKKHWESHQLACIQRRDYRMDGWGLPEEKGWKKVELTHQNLESVSLNFSKREQLLVVQNQYPFCFPNTVTRTCHTIWIPHLMQKKSSSSPVRFQRRALLHSDSDLCGN